jgi:hypothetical protein
MRPIKTSYPVWYRLCLRSDCDIEVIARVLVEIGRSRKDAKGAKTQRTHQLVCAIFFASLHPLHLCVFNSSRVPSVLPLSKPLTPDDMDLRHS